MYLMCFSHPFNRLLCVPLALSALCACASEIVVEREANPVAGEVGGPAVAGEPRTGGERLISGEPALGGLTVLGGEREMGGVDQAGVVEPVGGGAVGAGATAPIGGQGSGGQTSGAGGEGGSAGAEMTQGGGGVAGGVAPEDAEPPTSPLDMGVPAPLPQDMEPPLPDMSPEVLDMTPPPLQVPASLRAYTANVENLPRTSDQCPGDWRDLYAYMSLEQKAPDLFLVQQLSGLAQLNTLIAHMNTQLGRSYAGLIAEANPTPFNSPCGAVKDQQTNAIIYDVTRFTPVGVAQVWQSYRNTGQACELNPQSRAKGIAQAFTDLQSGAQVAVASIHWATANGTGADPACAVANAQHTQQVFNVHFPSASLYIWGGDSNEEDTVSFDTTSAYRGWYQQVNSRLGGALGYRDVIWDTCNQSGDVRTCLLGEWTFKNEDTGRRKRIDFLFTKASNGRHPTLNDAHTVSFREAGEADLALTGSDNANVGYSDHRAVWAELTYSP